MFTSEKNSTVSDCRTSKMNVDIYLRSLENDFLRTWTRKHPSTARRGCNHYSTRSKDLGSQVLYLLDGMARQSEAPNLPHCVRVSHGRQ